MTPAAAGAVRIHVSSILFEYTSGKSELRADGATIDALLDDLDRRHPGLRFRLVDEQDQIRPHIKVYVDGRMAKRLSAAVSPGSEVHVLQALSGG